MPADAADDPVRVGQLAQHLVELGSLVDDRLLDALELSDGAVQ